jgi:hypothetical protein
VLQRLEARHRAAAPLVGLELGAEPRLEHPLGELAADHARADHVPAIGALYEGLDEG